MGKHLDLHCFYPQILKGRNRLDKCERCICGVLGFLFDRDSSRPIFNEENDCLDIDINILYFNLWRDVHGCNYGRILAIYFVFGDL